MIDITSILFKIQEIRILNKKHNFTPWKFFVNDDFQLYMADMIINGKSKIWI